MSAGAAAAACCGQSGDRAALWMHSRTIAERQAAVDEDAAARGDLPVGAWAARREHADFPNALVRGALREGFTGEGLRLVATDCNRYWPRPGTSVSLICAQCGRGRSLKGSPRGWPHRRSARWRRWLTASGVALHGYRFGTSAYGGLVMLDVRLMETDGGCPYGSCSSES